MTDAGPPEAAIRWLTGWQDALAEARVTRRVVLVDVWKDP